MLTVSTADTGNPTAQQFYAALGVVPDDSKIFYWLAGEALGYVKALGEVEE